MAVVDTDAARARLKVCVVGSGTRFVSGISYYTYFLGCALKQRYDVVAILMRHLIPRRWYPGRQRVGHSVMAYDLAAEVPTFDGVDWWGWPSVPRAASFLRAQRPDVLILQWWSASVLPWYLLLARQAIQRRAVVVVELHEDQDTGEARVPLIGWFARRGLKTLCRWASMLVVHSAWDLDRISASLGIEPAKFRVIPHGPYPISGAAPVEATRPRPARPLREPSELTVLFFGTIRPYKGLEHLIGAFEQIRRGMALPWKLVVVGETWEGWTLPLELIEGSPYRDDIEVVNRYVTDQEAAGYFERADIVALPYLRSSASGPLAIAQACGLPVVVTAVGGLVEAAADYTGAVLVQPGNSADLARGLVAAADLRGGMHTAPVTWQTVAQSYADIFAAVVPAAEPADARTKLKPSRLFCETSGGIHMVFTDFATRLGVMMVLRFPRGYELLTPQWRYILLYRMHRPHEQDFRALPLLKFSDQPLLIDVGGNIGQSVLSLYTVFPAATVVSFEPNPIVLPKLQRLTKKFPRLTVIPNGLSDQTGEAELFVPSYNGNILTGLASFDYDSARDWLSSDRVLRFDPAKLTVLSRRLPLVRLDDCGLRPDFVKIDVQGLEHRVLAGGLATIQACRPVIMAETIRCGSNAHKVVEPLDYRLMEFDGHGFKEVRGTPRQLNQFLIPAERLPDPP